MKKIVFLFILIIPSILLNAQDDVDIVESALNASVERACYCVDSIIVDKKSNNDISNEVEACIDKEVVAYQTQVQLMAALGMLVDEKGKKRKTSNKIIIYTDKNSTEYKKYYYEIERKMMDDCQSLKEKAASNNEERETSMSKNPIAINWYKEGVKAQYKKQFIKAVNFYKQALEEDSLFVFAWDNLGLCYRNLNEYDNAISAYKKSLEIDSLGTVPLQNIAVVYMYKKEYENAVKTYEKLKALDENNPEIYYGIGHVYYAYLSDYEKALRNMCKAYNIYVSLNSPYRTDAENIIKGIYVEMKKEKNEKLFKKILEENNIQTED